MTDKEKLIKLIKTGDQCNIDLGIYQWLAQGFDKKHLGLVLFGMVNKWELFNDKEIQFGEYKLTYIQNTTTWIAPWVVRTEKFHTFTKETIRIVSIEALKAALSNHIEVIINKTHEELANPE
jgi:hypothetical protein